MDPEALPWMTPNRIVSCKFTSTSAGEILRATLPQNRKEKR